MFSCFGCGAAQVEGMTDAEQVAVCRTNNIPSHDWLKGIDLPADKLPDRKLEDFYELESMTGHGATSCVLICKSLKDGTKYAAKRVDKRKMTAMYSHQSGSIAERMRAEIEISMKLKHKHLIEMMDVFETERHVWVIMELMSGGELFDYIIENNKLNEADAVVILYQLTLAINYIHTQNIIHRDLKPENVMLRKRPDPKTDSKIFIKIIDFGMSKMLSPGMSAQSCLGTPGYIAPEVMARKSYTSSVDMYAVGVISYIILCGYMPMKISSGEVVYPAQEWGDISDDAKSFISSLILYDPKKRLTSKQALQHNWLKGHSDKKAIKRRCSMLHSGQNLAAPLSRKDLRTRRSSAIETMDLDPQELASLAASSKNTSEAYNEQILADLNDKCFVDDVEPPPGMDMAMDNATKTAPAAT